MTPALDQTFALSTDAMFREIDREAVILDLRSGTYFGLNATGVRIWQLLAADGRLRTVVRELCREFEAPPEQLEKDLLDLVTKLVDAGLGELKTS